MARRAHDILARTLNKLPLWAVAPLIRTWFAGWPLPGRFGDHTTSCVMCGAPGPIFHEHLQECPKVSAWSEAFDPAGSLDVNGGLGALGLEQDPEEVKPLATCLFWLGLWEAWLFVKHGRTHGSSTSTIRHRLRHAAIRDGRVAGAIKIVRGAGFLPAG